MSATNLMDLPEDVIYYMSFSMDLKSLSKFCQTHSNIRYLCEKFIKQKYFQEFGENLNSNDNYISSYKTRQFKKEFFIYVYNQVMLFPIIDINILNNTVDLFVNEVMNELRDYLDDYRLFFISFEKYFSDNDYIDDYLGYLNLYHICNNIFEYITSLPNKHLFSNQNSMDRSHCPNCHKEYFTDFLNKYEGYCKICKRLNVN